MDDTVIYLQCPHCKKGWYGPHMYTEIDRGVFKGIYIQGLAPTNLMEELTCLNCGHKYTPITSNGNGVVYNVKCHITKMWDWVAKLLTTCQGH